MPNLYFPIYPSTSTPTQTPKEISPTGLYPLGTKLEARDGRIWRYCKAGGVELACGRMGQTPAIADEIENEVQTGTTTNIGDTTVSVLVSTGSGLTASDLDGGYMVVEDVTGENHYYKIGSASWITGDTVLRLLLDEPINVATAADSEISLYPNIWAGIVVSPAAGPGGYSVGVTNCVVTAENFYWAQRKGPCSMVVDAEDTIVLGEPAGKPGTNATEGAVGVVANDGTDMTYGIVMGHALTTETALIYLSLE